MFGIKKSTKSFDLQGIINKGKSNTEIFREIVKDDIILRSHLIELLKINKCECTDIDNVYMSQIKFGNIDYIVVDSINCIKLPILYDGSLCPNELIMSRLSIMIDTHYNSRLMKLNYDYISRYRTYMYLINIICETKSNGVLYNSAGILAYAITLSNESDGKMFQDMSAELSQKKYFGAISCKEILNDKECFIRKMIDFSITKLSTEKDSLKRMYGMELEEVYGIC